MLNFSRAIHFTHKSNVRSIVTIGVFCLLGEHSQIRKREKGKKGISCYAMLRGVGKIFIDPMSHHFELY